MTLFAIARFVILFKVRKKHWIVNASSPEREPEPKACAGMTKVVLASLEQ